MKRLFTLALLGLTTTGLQAQITINQSSFASWTPNNDSIRRISGTITTSTGANGVSDITAATYAPVITRTVVAATHPSYPSATYLNTLADAIPSSTNGGIFWTSNQHRGITANGLEMYGESISRQAFVIIPTGNPNDSVVIPTQDVPYSTTRTMLKFPATMGTSWTNNFKYTVNLQLSVAMYGMVKTPAARVTQATETSNVTGWGKVRVRRADSSISSAMDVLVVKNKVEFLDSLMLMGTPAPAGMINGFGFTQGRITAGYSMNYYRAGESTPLLRVFYTDSTYTTMNGGEVHMNRLAPQAAGVPGVAGAASFSIYPNPAVAGSDLNIQLSETATGSWTIQLTDAAGRVVRSVPVQFNSNKTQISLDGLPAAGMHYLRLFRDGRSEGVTPVVVR